MKTLHKALVFLLSILILISIVSCKTETIIYGEPSKADVALIFYPGGNVNPNAYEDLCSGLAENGIPVIVVGMPMNLAVFGINRASRIIRNYPDVDCWYIGGHSLGGAVAALWAARHQKDVDGVVFLAAYSTRDLSVPVLSIYGSDDGVLDMKNYRKNLERISDVKEYVIEGGNHCQFGSYGFQKGDNEAFISHEEQIYKTVETVVSFIKGAER